MPSKKAGQPQPLANLVVLRYNGAAQPAHSYTPGSVFLSYSPEPGRSVPLSRRMRNCSGDSTARHSASDFCNGNIFDCDMEEVAEGVGEEVEAECEVPINRC